MAGSAACDTRPEFWPVTLLSVALVAVLGGWGAAAYLERTRSEPACARADHAAGRGGAEHRPAGPGDRRGRLAARERCLDVVVEARESADVLRDLARPPAPPSAARPDAWLPESTLWLRRARAAGAFQVPAEGVSVASTPVVLALDGRSATRLGWPGGALGWSDAGRRRTAAAAGGRCPTRRPARSASARWSASRRWPGAADAAGGRRGGHHAPAARRGPSRWPARRRRCPPGPAPTRPRSSAPSRRCCSARPAADQVAVYPPRPVPGPDYPYAVLTSGSAARGRRRVPARAARRRGRRPR